MLGLVSKRKFEDITAGYVALLKATVKKLEDGYIYTIIMPDCDTPTLQRIQLDMERLLRERFTNIIVKLFGRDTSREASIRPCSEDYLKELEPEKIGGDKIGKKKHTKRNRKQKRE